MPLIPPAFAMCVSLGLQYSSLHDALPNPEIRGGGGLLSSASGESAKAMKNN